MSLLTRKRSVLAKIESTYGVDSVPGAANAMLVKNLSVTPIQASLVSRDLIRPFLGNSEQLITEKSVLCEFEVEFVGSGTVGTAPGYDALLRACAFAKASSDATAGSVYKPVSAAFDSLSLYYNVDGVLHKLTGCVGTFEISLAVKTIPSFKFSFTGLYNDPVDAVAPAVDFSAFKIPQVANTQNTPGFKLFGYSAPLESMSLSLANDVQYITLIGKESVKILDRKPAGSFVFEAPHIAEKDFFSLVSANTSGAMQLVHGTQPGYIMQLDCPSVLLGNPAYQDSNGVQMLSTPFTAQPTSAGNDEVSITIK
ncbi:MAG: hypothetical protein EOP89_07925 [Lysobacteraceae bacterium]|nr:MAG: hypothetical protein EOP89_07925 [Xanthomonadaceae bacterium]